MDRIKKIKYIRLGSYAFGVVLLVVATYFLSFSELESVTSPIGIKYSNLVYPYQIEGIILFAIGTVFELFGLYYSQRSKTIKDEKT
jgi:hypothetical protein